MKVIAVYNQKGGVAKTTSAVNVAAGIKRLRPKSSILLIEADAQGSIKTYFRFKHSDTDSSFYRFLVDGIGFGKDNTHKADAGEGLEFDVLLASKKLSEADARLFPIPRREEILRVRFKDLPDKWDYVVIDCPPALNVVTQNIMTFANYILIPSTMDSFAITAINGILEQVSIVEKVFERKIEILGVLPTIFDQRSALGKGTLAALKKSGKIRVFDLINVDSAIKRAQVKMKTAFHFLGKSRAADQYLKLCQDILNLIDEPAKASTGKRRQAENLNAEI